MSINSKIAPPKLQHCFQGHLETGDDPVGNHWPEPYEAAQTPVQGTWGEKS